jgi:integrase
VSRDDDFNSPIVHGVWTVSGGDGARALSDDEIRILWKVASEGRNAYDHFIRFCLLTATRLSEAAEMPRSELSPDGTEWTIPSKRYKGQDGKSAHAHLIPLSPLAREVLSAVPQLGSDYVFTGRGGKKPIAGFNELKKAFDQRLRATLEQEGERTYDQIIRDLNERYPGKGFQPFDDGWKTHSLRKTARTLLDRVGIDTRIAEKCLGHIQIGLLKTYNHHEAKPEKRTAFEALAREIERIVEGKRSNIIPLSRA